MSASPSPDAPMKSLLVRPIRAITLAFVLLLTLALGALATTTWFNLKRIDTVRARVTRTDLLQQAAVLIKEAQLRVARDADTHASVGLERVRTLLADLRKRGGPIGTFTQSRIQELEGLLARADADPIGALRAAGDVVDRMLQRESDIQHDLLESIRGDVDLERKLAAGALIVFPCLGLLTLMALRQRVLQPITNLRVLLSRLSDGDFSPVPLDGADKLLRPLLENYNHMVQRLAQLEDANRKRTQSLTEEVRAATRTLLSQQQRLTRAERLAAAGEVSAGLAHELRNPIAGIHVSLANLRKELRDEELGKRLDMVTAELQRTTRLLNGLLQQSAHTPETPHRIEIGALVRELATLLRYQIPAHVELRTRVEDALHCVLPEEGLRQALLNLVFNSVEALGESPGTITISATQLDGGIRIEVSDDGPGFPDAMLKTGVRPFATFKEDGTGLGLAIVKRFANDLGGSLRIANLPTRGALVAMILPCDERDTAADRG